MSAIFFTLTRVTPGAPVSVGENPKIRQEQVNRRLHNLGLTDINGNPYSIPESYVRYLAALVHGNLGDSYQYNEPVTMLLMQRLPNSILLLGAAQIAPHALVIPLR